MGFLDFIRLPFTCFFGSSEHEGAEAVEDEDIIGEILMRKDSRSESNWPPKKHKAPFIATMAEYWDSRIAELLAKKQNAMQKTARQMTMIKVKGAVEI